MTKYDPISAEYAEKSSLLHKYEMRALSGLDSHLDSPQKRWEHMEQIKAELKEIERDGNQKLRAYKKNMGQDVYAQTLGNYVAQRLRERFGIPRLSLFYL